MIEITNIAEVERTIDKWLADVEVIATKFCRGYTVQLFQQILKNSVQYSGDFAANWKYSLNAPDTSFGTGLLRQRFPMLEQVYGFGKEEAGTLGAFRAIVGIEKAGIGYHEAIALSLRANRGRDAGFKLGDTVYLSNSSTHDEAYAPGIETGSTKLRDKSNMAPVARAVEQVAREYGRSGYKGVTRVSQLDSLRRRPGPSALGE